MDRVRWSVKWLNRANIKHDPFPGLHVYVDGYGFSKKPPATYEPLISLNLNLQVK